MFNLSSYKASTSIILTSFLLIDPHNGYLIRAYLREYLIFVTAHVPTVSLLWCSSRISVLYLSKTCLSKSQRDDYSNMAFIITASHGQYQGALTPSLPTNGGSLSIVHSIRPFHSNSRADSPVCIRSSMS